MFERMCIHLYSASEQKPYGETSFILREGNDTIFQRGHRGWRRERCLLEQRMCSSNKSAKASTENQLCVEQTGWTIGYKDQTKKRRLKDRGGSLSRLKLTVIRGAFDWIVKVTMAITSLTFKHRQTSTCRGQNSARVREYFNSRMWGFFVRTTPWMKWKDWSY